MASFAGATRQYVVVSTVFGLSVTLTFLSLVFWSYVIGPLGALLAVPLSLFIKALPVDADPASRWLVPLIDPGSEDRSGGKRLGCPVPELWRHWGTSPSCAERRRILRLDDQVGRKDASP
jgi:hypothetical protein